ncbi:MAG: hypothetical protein HEQ23_03825 [Tepidisphaera sp.]
MKTRFGVAAVSLVLSGSVLGQTWTYIPNLQIGDVSRDAGVVVGTTFGGSARWTRAGGLQVFGTEPGFGRVNVAQVVTSDGGATFGFSSRSSGRDQLYRWQGPGTFSGLGNYTNAERLDATDANGDGTVVVGTASAGQGAVFQSYVWTPQRGVQTIPGLIAFSTAEAVSADGTLIAGSRRTASNNTEAYLWSSSLGVTVLPRLHGQFSEAYDMSADGRYVVGVSESLNGGRAVIWEAGMVRSLGVLENFNNSTAYSISDDGSIVTGRCREIIGPVDPNNDEFVWSTAWGMLPLREFLGRHGVETPLGMYLDDIRVSKDGLSIYGSGFYGTGDFGTFIIAIPTPSISLVLLGVSLLGRTSRCRKSLV